MVPDELKKLGSSDVTKVLDKISLTMIILRCLSKIYRSSLGQRVNSKGFALRNPGG